MRASTTRPVSCVHRSSHAHGERTPPPYPSRRHHRSPCCPACPSTARQGLSRRHRRCRRLSCRASISSGGLDRRGVLLGLTAGGLGMPTLEAVAASSCDVVKENTKLQLPFDFTAKDCFVCKPSPDKDGQVSSVCFPALPIEERIILFSDLPLPGREIVRPPAHELRPEQLDAYRRGIQRMRELPADHPHSLAYQASIHHTFCYGHYKRGDADGDGFNVHSSWLFAPWHRMYIYFFERILRSYAGGDDGFALPYWNWDEPAGMKLPDAFKDGALYDENRNPNHVNNCFVDLNYGGKNPDPTSCVPFTSKYDDASIVTNNLTLMYKQQMNETAPVETFLGKKYYLRQATTPGGGDLEQMAHTAIHRWTGGDMGDFKTAAKDPIFYAHHANIDRLWHVWNNERAGDANRSKGFDDKEWLDSTFLFHDEEVNLVKVKVSDVLDLSKLGYRYQQPEGGPAWKDARSQKSEKPLDRPSETPALSQFFSFFQQPAAFPVTLALEDGPVKVPVAVSRPRKAVAAGGRGNKTEVLEVQGIEFDPSEFAKFDVCINVSPEDAAELGPRYSEFAGSFVNVPQAEKSDGMPMKLTTSRQLVLDELLRDIGCASDSSINVVLIPRSDQNIKVGNITIKLLD